MTEPPPKYVSHAKPTLEGGILAALASSGLKMSGAQADALTAAILAAVFDRGHGWAVLEYASEILEGAKAIKK